MTQHYINSTQQYAAMGYLPYVFVNAHLLFAASGPPARVKFPTVQYEKTLATQKSRNIMETLVTDMRPSSRRFSSASGLVFDTLPHVLNIIRPNLRAVNTQLYSAREKDDLKQLVQILLSYNLTYAQERTPDGQYVYRLDPGVEDVVHFPDIPHPSLPYAVKQMIAHEVDVERMRRDEPLPPPEAAPRAPENKPAAVPNHLNQKLKAKDVVERDVTPTDFFGRKLEVRPSSAVDASSKNSLLSSDIWFKFKEGYNNAVRRIVRVQDLA